MWTHTTTLRDAVLRCTAAACGGIAWQSNGETNAAKAQTGTHTFRGCPPGKTAAEPAGTANTWTLYTKNLPTIEAITPEPVAKISFQLAGVESKLSADFTIDEGALYGARENSTLAYGWNCPTAGKNTPKFDWNKKGAMTEKNSYIKNMQAPCADGTQRRWELQVPSNGVYQVTTYHSRERTKPNNDVSFLAGCNFENVKLVGMGNAQGRVADGKTYVVGGIEVTDGRLTFQGWEHSSYEGLTNRDRCSTINYIEVEKVGTKLPSAWLPSSLNPYWQMEVEGGGANAIGLVTIQLEGVNGLNPLKDDCRSWWLWRGDKCPSQRQLDTFDVNGDGDEGAIVVVTDKPCTAAGGCPALNADRTGVVGDAASTVCKIITRTTRCARSNSATRTRSVEYRLCPVEVNCKGATGKYVYFFRMLLPVSIFRKYQCIVQSIFQVCARERRFLINLYCLSILIDTSLSAMWL